MKGVNVQKIAALAAGVVLLGASVAVADVVYGSTQLVDQNGQPTVKVVVGSKAAASDGVAAANIAAAIANQAYKSSVLTPTVSGTAVCNAGSGTGGSSCTFTDKKVTLEVQLPGAAGGAAIFNTLVNDFVDRNLGNRVNTGSDDKYLYSNSDTGPDSNAFSDQGGVTGSATAAGLGITTDTQPIYRIGASDFAALQTSTLSDGSNSYTEQQNMWVKGKAYYNPSSNVQDFIGDFSNGVVAWSAKFTQDDYGIPVCSKITNTQGDWTTCASSDLTERKRMKVNFLGDAQWIISAMSAPTTDINATTGMENGGSITLAKEAAYQIINVGETLEAGAISLRLADISTATGAGNVHPAIIDLLDSSGTVVKQVQVDPGTTDTETIAGVDYKIHVYQTAPGFTLNAKWAEVAVYSDELILNDGQQLDSTDNKNFYALLKWKNKDYKSSTSSNASRPDTLRQLVIYDTLSNMFTGSNYGLKNGDKYQFIAKPAIFELQFNGLDLTSDDYDTLTYSVTKDPVTFRNCSNTTQIIGLGGSLELRSSTSSAFSVSGYSGNSVYYDLSNSSANFSRVFVRSTGATVCYDLVAAGVAGNVAQTIQYYVAGDAKDTTSGGAITISWTAPETGTTLANISNTSKGMKVDIGLYEDMGKVNSTSQNAAQLNFTMNNSAGTSGYGGTTFSDFGFLLNSGSTTHYVSYKPSATISASSYAKDNTGSQQEGFYSDRGSQFAAMSRTDLTLKVAKKVGHLQFAVTSVGGNLTSTTDETLGVGATTTFGAVKVTVKDITGTGTCTAGAGGTPLCSPDMTGVSALIDGKPSIEASVPYALPKDANMVVLDTPAPSASVLITVGGPAVNAVTADALQGSGVDFTTDAVVVKEIGQSRIVVAGATAADTMTAAQNFINGIVRN